MLGRLVRGLFVGLVAWFVVLILAAFAIVPLARLGLGDLAGPVMLGIATVAGILAGLWGYRQPRPEPERPVDPDELRDDI